MLNAPVMEANDAVSGSMAECYVTIDGNRYNMMQLYSFESSAKVDIQDVKLLGRTGKGKKPSGWSGSWKGTAHFNQSVFRRWFLIYCKTGRMTPFEIQVSNEDPSSSAGRQTITHTGCLIDSSILAKFDAGDTLRSFPARSTTGICRRNLTRCPVWNKEEFVQWVILPHFWRRTPSRLKM